MNVWVFPSFYPYDYPGMQGAGIFAHRQYKGLAANGANVKVVQPVMWHPIAPFSSMDKDWKTWSAYNYPKQRVYDGLTVYHPRVANMKPSRIFKKTHAARYSDAIVKFFKQNKIHTDRSKDIFFAQWLPDAYMVQLAAHKMGLRSAILVIGDDVTIWPHANKERMELFKDSLVKADMLFSIGGYLAKEANRLVGKDLKFNVIRRGVNYDFFQPVSGEEKLQFKKEFGLPEDKTIILTIARADVRKGWLDLFDALKELKKENDQFVLVAAQGDKSAFDLNEEARKRGLENDFINLGEVDPDKITKLYNTADIFCLPSHSEGVANSVAEAMSTGVAVITTNVGGHPELVDNGVNGILVPPKDPTVLYNALSSLMKDSRQREELGRNARNFIVNEWGSFADNAALLYKKLSEF